MTWNALYWCGFVGYFLHGTVGGFFSSSKEEKAMVGEALDHAEQQLGFSHKVMVRLTAVGIFLGVGVGALLWPLMLTILAVVKVRRKVKGIKP